MITLYKTRSWGNRISEHEFAKVTQHYAVATNGRREALATDSESFHETREAAVQHKFAQLQRDVGTQQARLQMAEKTLAEFRQQEGLDR